MLSKDRLNILPGMTIDGQWSKKKFLVIKSLGKGGFGTVYLVIDLVSGEQKALKISRDMLTLVREFTVLEKLKHMSVRSDFIPRVELLDDSIVNGQVFGFIIMEYIKGPNLRSFLQNRRLSAQEVYKLVKLLGALLSILHNCGYVYCDLKPENILYDIKHAIFRLVDFGGVREIGSTVAQFTPAFDRASYGCGPRKADPGYDVFALAALMVTLTTGKDPQPKNPELSVTSEVVAIVWEKARQNKFKKVAELLRECEVYMHNAEQRSAGIRVAIYSLGIFSVVVFGLTLLHLL